MAPPVLAFSMLSLVVLSILPAYADTGTIQVVAGKAYQVGYVASGVNVQSIQTNPTYEELVAQVQVSSPNALLELTIPRSLLDSKQGSGDIPFIVVIDGTLGNVEEKNPTPDSRTIAVQLSPDNKQVEIIGTYVAVSGPAGSTAPAVPSSTQVGPATVANQTSTTQVPGQGMSSPQKPNSAPPTQTTIPTVSGENFTASKNATQNLVFKVPYLPSVEISLSYVDMGVIGAIAIVIAIVIASAARKNGRVVRKSP